MSAPFPGGDGDDCGEGKERDETRLFVLSEGIQMIIFNQCQPRSCKNNHGYLGSYSNEVGKFILTEEQKRLRFIGVIAGHMRSFRHLDFVQSINVSRDVASWPDCPTNAGELRLWLLENFPL